MKKFASIFVVLQALALILLPGRILAQGTDRDNVFGNVVRFDKTVHDFGDIMVSDGPVSATFTLTNVSSAPIAIYNVASSCGCTSVEWTKKPLKSGESGTVKATYKNDEGGYPFDKTLTVYVSSLKQPVVVHLRGESHAKKLSLSQMYPVKFGSLGMKSVEIKCGNMSQGQQKSGETTVANLGTKPVTVSFASVSEGLSLSVSPNPIPAGEVAKMKYTVTADRNHWGKNMYYAVPMVDGRSFKAVVSQVEAHQEAGTEAITADPDPQLGNGSEKIGVYAVTKENFSSWTKEQKDNASQPMAKESTSTFGRVKAGTKVKASFSITNKGKSDFKVYKVDSETLRATVGTFPDLAPGKTADLNVTFDTTGLPSGETLVVLTVITNSPLRPIMNLFLSGWIE